MSEVDWVNFTAQEAYEFGLLPLVLHFEARNQGYPGMVAVGWTIRNRVESPRWWGWDYPSVIMKHYRGVYQYSSFAAADPNSTQFPHGNEPDWQDELRAAVDVFTGSVFDPTIGADSYYDNSIPAPAWATPENHTVDIGAFRFHKTR
jgi:N-acetylmuramoyl-L-alanine amidase